MPKELVMLDDSVEEKTKTEQKTVAIALGDDFELISKVLIIPMDRALKVAASIIMQVDLDGN